MNELNAAFSIRKAFVFNAEVEVDEVLHSVSSCEQLLKDQFVNDGLSHQWQLYRLMEARLKVCLILVID